MTLRRQLILAAVAAALVIGLILRVHPDLFTSRIFRGSSAEELKIWRTVDFKNRVSALPLNPVMYRGSANREARVQVRHTPRHLRPLWESEKWNVGIHSASKASPVSDGQRVFIGSDSSWFGAFSLADGKKIWSFFAGESSRGIHSTAALDSTGVYVGSYRGTLYKFGRENGELLWSRTLGDTIGASPWLGSGVLVLAVETNRPDGYLMKVDSTTGEIIWRSPSFGEQSHSSPSYDAVSDLFVVGVNNSTLQAFHGKTGERAWSLPSGGAVKSTILIHEGRGYATSWGHEFFCFDVATGQLRWRVPLTDESQTSPVWLQNKGLVVAADKSGRFFAIHANTGKMAWQKSFSVQNPQISSPVVLVDEKQRETLLTACAKNELCLLNDEGRVFMQVPLGGRLTGVPWVEGDRILVSLNGGGVKAFLLAE